MKLRLALLAIALLLGMGPKAYSAATTLPDKAGDMPFTGTLTGGFADLTTPNPTYWAAVDQIITTAAARGITAWFNPISMAASDTIIANGATRARTFGQFLGTRYAQYDNIIWLHGNEYTGPVGSELDNDMQQIAMGIKDKDPRHLSTLWLTSGVVTTTWWTNIVDFFTASDRDHPSYLASQAAYDAAGGKPIVFIEGVYEGETSNGTTGVATPLITRQEAYDSSPILGTAGTFFGDTNHTWPSTWQTVMTSTGNTQMQFFPQAFAGRQWWKLVPDENHSVVTAGYGGKATGGFAGDNYAPAARVPDGSLIMAYLPGATTITVDMTKSVNNAYSHWYNPQTGALTQDAGPLANTGTHAFTPPTTGTDWVFILDTQGTPGSQETADNTDIKALDVPILNARNVKFYMHNTDNSTGLGKDVTKIYKNDVVMAETSGLVELSYVNHYLWQLNAVGNWYSLQNDDVTWVGPTTISPMAVRPKPPTTIPTPPSQ